MSPFSALSKKLAAGLGALVMDVKTGSGAFAAEPAMARELAESIVTVAGGAGLRTTALITDMDRVLGDSVGNALEVAEAAAYLTGKKGTFIFISITSELERRYGKKDECPLFPKIGPRTSFPSRGVVRHPLRSKYTPLI